MIVHLKPLSSAGSCTVAPRAVSSSMLAAYTSRWMRCLTVFGSGTWHMAIDWYSYLPTTLPNPPASGRKSDPMVSAQNRPRVSSPSVSMQSSRNVAMGMRRL